MGKSLVMVMALGLLGCSVEGGVELRGDLLPGEICSETDECVPGSLCFNDYCVGSGDLRVSLAFEADTDLDLHVRTPLGSEIYFNNAYSDGGALDVDQCVSSCGYDMHVENIVFSEVAPEGVYEVWVENYSAREAAVFSIEVDRDGEILIFEGEVPALSSASSSVFEFVY